MHLTSILQKSSLSLSNRLADLHLGTIAILSWTLLLSAWVLRPPLYFCNKPQGIQENTDLSCGRACGWSISHDTTASTVLAVRR